MILVYLIAAIACGIFWKNYLGFGLFYGALGALLLSPVVACMAPFYIRVAADDGYSPKKVSRTLQVLALVMALLALFGSMSLGFLTLILTPLSFLFSYVALHALIVPSIHKRQKLAPAHDDFRHRF